MLVTCAHPNVRLVLGHAVCDDCRAPLLWRHGHFLDARCVWGTGSAVEGRAC